LRRPFPSCTVAPPVTARTLEEAVELLGVDAVGAFDFAVEPGCARLDVGVVDALVQHVPVERGLEFCAVVCLDHLDPERQPLKHVVDEADRGGLVEPVVDAQHPQPGAVVDGGELVELAPGPPEWGAVGGGQRLDELDVALHPVTGQQL
jgi:hypothetical protein